MAYFENISPEELKELSRRGGIASGEARRERRLLREELSAILAEGDVQKNMCAALVQKALEGNLYAYQLVRDTLGERINKAELTVSGNLEAFKERNLPEIQKLFFDPRYEHLARALLSYEEIKELLGRYEESEVVDDEYYRTQGQTEQAEEEEQTDV